MRPRLCYVLPRYDESTDTHYRYLYEMLDDLARDVDLYVVVEKSWGTVTRPWPKVRVIPTAARLSDCRWESVQLVKNDGGRVALVPPRCKLVVGVDTLPYLDRYFHTSWIDAATGAETISITPAGR